MHPNLLGSFNYDNHLCLLFGSIFPWSRDRLIFHRLFSVVNSTSYPRFNDGGSRVQNALHLPQGRDHKKITGDNSRHRVS